MKTYLKLLYSDMYWNFYRTIFNVVSSEPSAHGTLWNLHNKIFEFTRNYLAAFAEGQFSHIKGLTRTSCEIWLKNEGLPTRESLTELYLWFLNERGVGRKEAMEDLVLLKEHYYEIKEMSYYNQKKKEIRFKW